MSETNNENVSVNGEAEQNNIPAETPAENQVEGTATEIPENTQATMPEEPHPEHEI